MLELLERDASESEDDDFIAVEIERKARETLGYRPALGNGADREARAALSELGIRPFTDASVQQYKSRMAINKGLRAGLRLGGVLSIAFVVIISCLSTLFGSSAFYLFPLTPLVWFASLFACERVFGGPRTWRYVLLSDYRARIPEFALQTAIDIKARCPGAVFFIDELTEMLEAVDPFLCVKLGGRLYYVEVWNEPKYKQQRDV